ncbi:DUF1642 domain-containing protein [Enterococcus thailandicus]|uniref:DUF1642 domain-containing protein n=1 Tax=Enterococcus thailandicus TaxID=417368 RepID=UPI0022E4862D|nr:DUF1642 domain-containing protein [Enterococcus thailandicus]
MNKQELIEKIKKAIKDELSGNYYREFDNYGRTEYEHYTEEDAQSVANDIILDLEEDLKQLDEPQRPVVSKFVAEEFLKKSKYSTDVIDLFSEVEYATDSDGLILEKWGWSVDFYDWLAKDSDTLYILCDALRYGYEVEKEPLYYVKHKNDDTYFVEFINSSFSSIWDDEINRIKSFKDKTKADAVAVLVSGEVVEG